MKLLNVLVLFSCFTYAGFYSEPPQGFLWYKDAPKLKKHEKTLSKPLKPLTYTQKNEALSKAFESSLHRAIEEPTLDNVRQVQALQHLIIRRSERFGETWMLASLMDGLLYDEKANPNPRHLTLMKEDEETKRHKDFKKISQHYGVFFIWKEDCRYCHNFLPIVQAFCGKYGFDLMAVSRSGATLPGIKSMKDNGMIDKVNIHHIYPALFLADLRSGEVYPIAWGLSTMSDLETNTGRIVGHVQEKKE